MQAVLTRQSVLQPPPIPDLPTSRLRPPHPPPVAVDPPRPTSQHLLRCRPPSPPPLLPNLSTPPLFPRDAVLHAWAHLYLMRQALAAPLAVRRMANKPAIHHSLRDDLDRNRHSLRDNHTVAGAVCSR